jgi:hemerythrin-like metal-binding protein/PAS domain S-box-containing protein
MPTNSIDIFPWDDNFNTGLPKVDEQHRKLVQMLNLLASHIAFDAKTRLLSQLFSELADYAVYHFDTEEAIWHEYLADDSAEVEHRAIHRSFVQEVSRLRASQESKAIAEVADETLGFLARWLASHILESDRYLAYVVLARKDGVPLDAAKRRAKEQMGGSTRALIDIILSIYSTLSANTLHLMRELADHRQDKEELLRTRQVLVDSEINHRAFFDTINDFLFVMDGQGNIIQVNRTVLEQLGYPEADLVGRSVLAVHPTGRHEEATQIISDMLAGNRDSCPIPLQAADGRLIPVETRVVAGQWNDQPALFGVSRDVSERRRLLEEASEREFFLRQTQQVAQIGGFRADPVSNSVMWTEGVYEIVEMPLDYKPNLETALDFYLPDSRRRVVECLQHSLATCESFSIQVQVRGARSGIIKWAELRGQPHLNTEGRIDYVMGTLQDITSTKNAEDELLRHRKHLEELVAERTVALRDATDYNRTLFETSPIGLALAEMDGTLVDVNPAYLRIIGYTDEEAKELTYWEITPQEYAPQEQQQLESLHQTGHYGPYEKEYLHKDGHRVPVVLSGLLLRTGSKQYIWSSVEDITTRKQVEVELHRAKTAAEVANIAKSAFLANMSHEIRTPMNAVIGMANLIRRGGLTPTQVEQMNKLEAAGTHLLDIIDNVLDLSKIEAGRLVLAESPVSIDRMLTNVSSILYERAATKGIRLLVETEPLPQGLVGDPTRLQQALLNYAINAVKFTEKGGVTLHVFKHDETADSVVLRFEVRDTGIGITTEAMSRLFTAFEQADNSMTRKYGGTGLGLTITQRLAGLMGGEVGADSTPGVGSTFWFTAKLKKGAAENSISMETVLAADAETVIRQNHAGSRVLVVDDEPINLEVAKMLLEEAGLTVRTAEDGADAIAMARQAPYAAIFMDMQMPKVNGLEATQEIRLLPGYRDTPIIAMTANAFSEDRARCLTAGMNDFLVKPFDPGTLFATLLRWLDDRNA